MSRPAKEQIRQLQDELARCRSNCRNHWGGVAVVWIGRILFAGVVGFGIYSTIAELAGKTTTADIHVNASGSVSASAGLKGATKDNTSAVKQAAAPPMVQEAASTLGKGVLINGWMNVFSICLGLGGLVFGMMQAKLRRDYIELYAPLQAEIERRLDPNRTSSQLTGRGQTRREDI